jgi:hypothetical protein
METVQLEARITFTQYEGILAPSEHSAKWILKNIVARNIK